MKKKNNPNVEANNINETLEFLFDSYPAKKSSLKEEEISLFI